MVINATCHGCRRWGVNPISALDRTSTTQPFIFAAGPGVSLSSDDPEAYIRRHIGHARFTLDMVKATGPGGVGLAPVRNTDGGVLVDGYVHSTEHKAGTAHGAVFVVASLLIAPFDALVAGTLRRWPGLHAGTSSVYVAFVIGALVPGVIISREHVAVSYPSPDLDFEALDVRV